MLVAPLRRVEAGWLLFNAAEWAIWVAILVYAYEATGPASVGLVAVAQLVPAAIAAPRAAQLADQFAPGRALTVAYAAIGLLMVATGGPMTVGLPPLIVYILAAAVVATYTSVRPIQIFAPADARGASGAADRRERRVDAARGGGRAPRPPDLRGPDRAGITGRGLCRGRRGHACGRCADQGAHEHLDVGHGWWAGPRWHGRTVAGPAVGRARRDRSRRAGHPAGGSWPAAGGRPARDALRRAAAAMDVLLVLAAIEVLDMGAAGAGYLSAAIGLGWIVGGAAACW